MLKQLKFQPAARSCSCHNTWRTGLWSSFYVTDVFPDG